MTVSLGWLMDGIAALPENAARVDDLTLDSRDVRPGSLFIALAGARTHGLAFAAEAAARGARVVLWEPGDGDGDGDGAADAQAQAQAQAQAHSIASTPGLFAVAVPGLRQLVGRIADRFFGWPSAHLRVIGITGTNGKTTSAYLLAQCLVRLGSDAAYIGTLGWGRIDALNEPTHTTPDVINVHRNLAHLRAAGVRDVAMEVSSHALDQGRVDAVRFHAAAFTNLTRDHLDYHGSMEAYGAAKARLFDAPDLQHLVINIGDTFGREYARVHTGRVPVTAVWVGEGVPNWFADRFVQAGNVAVDLHGIAMSLAGSFGRCPLATRLLGRFNAENCVVVVGCLLSLGVTLSDAAAALGSCAAPPGRMEVVDPGVAARALAVIDYAHTPDALDKALNALREHCRGELWCVFGCGGDRDPGKRPLMGAVADELADRIIVTDDNPRSENPQAITCGITAGIHRHEARVINDRSEAIGTALREAQAADVVLIAGKGHENYQIYGDVRRAFSDRSVALQHLGTAA